MSSIGFNGRPVAIDLFSGVGGLSLGLEQAGFDVLAAVDSDPIHVLTYHHNFPGTAVVCEDVATMTGAELRAVARLGATRLGRAWSGEIDCIAAGPSCQGFSVIGSHDPTDHRNTLVLEFARLVAEVQPRYFVLENVPGLLSPPHRPMLDRLTNALRAAGYNLGASPWTLDAYDFGVPQRRRRVFLIGSRVGLALPLLPEGEGKRVTVGDAISDLLSLEHFPASAELNEMILSPEELGALAAAGGAYVRMLRGNPRAGDLSAPRQWDRSLLTGVAGTVHVEAVRQRFAAMRAGERDAKSRLPKLGALKPSPTLRAGTGRDHGSHTSVRPVHYEMPRVLTVREAARLHSFPDWFRFHSTRWHAWRQIGNSVPPALARAVASTVVSALGAAPKRRASVGLGDSADLNQSLVEAAQSLGVDPARLPASRRRAA